MKAGLSVARMPLLAVDVLERVWGPGVDPRLLDGPDDVLDAALEADRVRARAVLRTLTEDPEIGRALQDATADLGEGLRRWRDDPASRRGRSAERSLIRYVTRMCMRPALFGTLGSYALAEIGGERAALTLAGRSSLAVRTQPDPAALAAVLASAAEAASGSDDLIVQRDPGLYFAAGGLRLGAPRRGGGPSAGRSLITLRVSPAVRAVVDAAARPTRIGDLVARAERHEPRGRDVVQRLLATGALAAGTQPTTGAGASAQALRALADIPGAAAARDALAAACAALAGEREDRRVIAAESLRRAGAPDAVARRIHVNSVRPAEIRLPSVVQRVLRQSVDLLASVAPARENPALVRFRERFEARYGTRPVPLLEAVDPDCGIGLQDGGVAAPGAAAAVHFELIERGRATGAVELTDADVAALRAVGEGRPPADAYGVVFGLRARDPAALERGEFAVVEPELTGPSGARLLGRLGDGDPDLADGLRAHVRAEEALRPDAVFAELACSPDTDWGLAVSYRPVLREWEVECGGRSGAASDRVLEVADLMLAFEGELVVRSRTLGRRVFVRSSTAVNPRWMSLPAVRLLRALEAQGRAAGLKWSWAGAEVAPVLPRVTRGRIVLARRRWNLAPEGLEAHRGRCDADAVRAVSAWRRRHGVPVRVAVIGVKGELAVNLSGAIGIEAFLAAVHGADRIRLVEAATAADSPLTGPDGSYAHEFIVTYVRDASPEPAPTDVSEEPAAGRPLDSAGRLPLAARRFAPGSEWLYAKLYGSRTTADAVLAGLIGALDLTETETWFFIRYADPEPHLRLRIRGEPRRLWAQLLPRLHEATAPALDDGRLYRVVLDTYEREVERFGGLAGVELMERAAHADSVAWLRLRRGGRSRQVCAVASVGALLADAGLTLDERESLCRAMVGKLNASGRSVAGLMAARERAGRAAVQDILAAVEPLRPAYGSEAEADADAVVAALRRRSAVLAPLVAGIDGLGLDRSTRTVVSILAHLQANRVLRESGADDELAVFDALARAYRAQRARHAEREGGRR